MFKEKSMPYSSYFCMYVSIYSFISTLPFSGKDLKNLSSAKIRAFIQRTKIDDLTKKNINEEFK